MSTINRLSSVDVLQPSDQIPVWDSSNGDTRKASMSTLLAFVESYFADPDYSTRIVAPNTDYFTVDIGATGDSIWMIVNPVLNFTTGTITLPSTAYAVNDQEITVVFTAAVINFSITSSGATVLGAPVSINSYDSFRVRYNASQQTWYTLDTTGDGAGVSQITRQDFTGDGTTTTFTLTTAPSALGNELQIFIDGIYQERSSYAVTGSDIVFSEAPPSLSTIEVLGWSVNIGTETSANLVSYAPAGTGAVVTSVQAKLQEIVSVKDFGAVGNGVTDDWAAFEAARTYCNDNEVHSLLIPPASYHLSEPWFVPSGGSYVPCRTVGDGAIVDNTVIIGGGTGLCGLTVDGAADAGFVVIRAQGAYHEYLVAKNCGSYGFYFGVASRQHLTVSSATGFQVGETVTGGTSGTFGVVERIDGNVLRLVKCNATVTANFFSSGETVTGGTSGASSTISSFTTPYGANYQVTRGTFNQLLAFNNGNKGFYWDGTATVNRSWMNACTIISPSGVSNSGKGWVVASFTAPGGGSQHNYNCFININMEGNSDQSLSDPNGRQNTYIGGHFADLDVGGTSVEITDTYNFVLGGRYLGTTDFSGTSFVSVNKDVGGTYGKISSMDAITNLGDLDVINEPLFYKGWSILPSSKLTYTVAGDNLNNHTLQIDMGDFVDGNYVNMRVFVGGYRNQAAAYAEMDHAQLTLTMSSEAGLTTNNAVSYAVASTEGISIDSVAISTTGVITITFDTTNLIFSTRNLVEFYDSDDTDPR